MIKYRTNASSILFGRIGNCFNNYNSTGYGSFGQGKDFTNYNGFYGFYLAKPNPASYTMLPLKPYQPLFYPCWAYGSFFRDKGDIVEDYSLDRLNTSKVLAFGDHNCYHYKINATIDPPNNRGYYHLPDDLRAQGYKWTTEPIKSIGGPLEFPCEGKTILFPVNRKTQAIYHMRYSLRAGEDPNPLWIHPSTIRKDLFIDYYLFIQTDVIKKHTPCETYTWRVACSSHGNFLCTKDTKYANTSGQFWSFAETSGYVCRTDMDTYPGKIRKDLLQLVYGDCNLPSTNGYYEWYDLSGTFHSTGNATARDNYTLGDMWLKTPAEIYDAAYLRNINRIQQYFYAPYKPVSKLHIYEPTCHSDGITAAQATAVRSYLFQQYSRFWDTVPLPETRDLGDVALEAAQFAQAVDINTIAYLKDVPGYIRQLRTVISILKSGISPSSALSQAFNPKTWASLYLFKKWGVDLTVEDTKELIAAAGASIQRARQTLQHDYRSCNARKFVKYETPAGYTVDRCICYKLYYQPYEKGLLGALKKLQDWDIYPTWQNMWDLIPFSFMVDWFVNVEKLLNSWDTVNYYQYLNIKSTVYSVKDTRVMPDYLDNDNQVVVHGITLVRYKRQVLTTPYPPHFRLEQSSGLNNHEIEAGAIIAQRF